MGQLPFERIPRERLVRTPATTDEKFGCYPEKRSVQELLTYGVVNLDKPSGPTSHQVSAYAQTALHINKAGHSGTLDPGVTGILPIALGRGTRIVQSLLTAGKEYVCLMQLHKEHDEETVKKALATFTGKLRQLPPVKSAVKRQWRYRHVYYAEFIEQKGSLVLFRIGCQAGTYIRKYCHDLGTHLGCGAHMAELRRTKVGPFREDETLVTLHDLADAYAFWQEGDETWLRKAIQPLERAVDHLPKIWVLDTTVDALSRGATLKAPGISAVETNIQAQEPVAVMTLKGELIAVGLAQCPSKKMITSARGVILKSSQVFLQPGTYPRR